MAAFTLNIPLYVDFGNGQKIQVALITTDPMDHLAAEVDRRFPRIDHEHVHVKPDVIFEPGPNVPQPAPDAQRDPVITPDYARDIRLVDIVAKIRYEQAARNLLVEHRNTWPSWKEQKEDTRSVWRETSIDLINRETGHGGK